MKNIVRLFLGDVKNATKSAVGVVVLVGLIVVPAMYAWFNILGGWDPYENTDGLKIAVANEDEGYSSDLVPVDLNIGDTVVSALRANDQFAWEFMDEDEAVEGVRSGAYYAAIVIPQSFSADMMTLFSTDIKHSDIVYYSNQKENAIAPRVTDKGAGAVQASIDETFASTVNEVGLKTISQLITFMDGDAMGSYAATLSRAMEYIEADLDNAADQVTAFSSLLASASSLVQTTADIMGDSGGATAASRSAIDEASAGLEGVGDALAGASSVADEALARSGESFDVISQNIDKGLDAAEKPAKDVHDGMKKASEDLQRLSDGLVKVRDAVKDIEASKRAEEDGAEPAADAGAAPSTGAAPSAGAAQSTGEDLVAKFDHAIASLTSLKKGIDGLSEDLEKTSATAVEDRKAVEGLLDEARASLSGVRSDYESGLAVRAETLRSTLSSVRDSAERVSGDVGYVLASLTSVSGSLAGDLDGTRSALDDVADALKDASAKLKNERARLSDALSAGDLEEVKGIIGSDPRGMASFLSSPVSIDRHSVYGIANYGSSMAAFYTVLSLWVGSIILVALMKVDVSDRRVAALGGTVRLHQRYLGRYCIFAVLALLQATFVCLGDLLFLGIQCEHPLLFMLAGWAVSLVFSFLVYTLVVSFGDIGKALAVVLLVMQVAGSGGTFPIEMTAPFFQSIYPFLPFTHGIAAMHACIGGIYGSEFWMQIGQLLLFLVPALLLGLVLRKPVIRLNDFIIEKLEETKIM